MSIPFKTSPVEFNQRQLYPSSIFDLLSQDNECFVFAALLEGLDTSSIERRYSVKGQHAYHPKTIVSILIYAYSRGVFSSRQIQRRCREDLTFMFIAQLGCPNFRVLSDFRKDHPEFFKECFKQTAQLARELKLASLGHISLDGSKFKADSSKHKAMSYGRLKENERKLIEEIEALIEQAARCDEDEDDRYQDNTGYEVREDLKYKEDRLAQIKQAREALEERERALNPDHEEIDDKKQISFADKQARIMGKHGDFDYRYNAQISVDKDTQIIVGQHLSQNANDKREVQAAVASIEDTTGRLPDKLSADNGYLSGDNLQALEDLELDAYIATGKGEKPHNTPLTESNRKLVKADFEYNETSNTYRCPGGQQLEMIRESKDGKRVYQGDSKICSGCEYNSRCCQSSQGAGRTITTDDKEPLRQKMNNKMEQERSKQIYKQRKVIVEPVFGQIKNSGFRGFSVRGLEKAAGEFSLVCATHNLKKIALRMIRGVIRPEFGKPALSLAQ